jgi:CBS domain containing-hemolysin-like protein
MYIDILILLILSALFSGLEIAFITSDKLRLEINKKQGKWNASIIKRISKYPKKFIATLLIANNIIIVIYGIVAANILTSPLHQITKNSFLVFLLQTIISAILILIAGEFIPKSIFRLKANSMLTFFAIPSFIIYYALYPVTWFFITLSNALIKLFHGNIANNTELIFGKVDIYNMVKQSISHIQNENDIENELKIFQNALTFDQVKLKECIIPRTEIVAKEINSSMHDFIETFIETGYSKLLIYKDNIDNIIGYIHIGDIFRNPTDIKSIIREVIIVPETMSANKLLTDFIQQKKGIALVVDEFGGTAGIVTIEDILEEIFGEINDEHDTNNFVEKKVSENEYVFSGRLEIDYLNEKYHLHIQESKEYETLAGYILFHYNYIPKPNETITLSNFLFKILKSSNTKIELIYLKMNSE